MTSREIIASTFGWDVSEVSDYRYQRYSAPSVYAVGDKYYAVSKTKPKHKVAGDWKEHGDQFFAGSSKTALWYCSVGDTL